MIQVRGVEEWWLQGFMGTRTGVCVCVWGGGHVAAGDGS